MLELVLGRSGSGKTAYCFNEIKTWLEENKKDTFCLFIVPDFMTYKVERELAQKLPHRGFFHVHVTGFHRLAKYILLETGGANYTRISDLGKKILLKKILMHRKEDLYFFGSSVNKRGFTDVLAEIFKEFQAYGVDEDHLSPFTKEGRVEEGSVVTDFLQKKMHDLALLYNDFYMELAGHYRDEENLEWEIIDKLSKSKLVKNARILVDGFTFFEPKNKEVLKRMLPLAEKVSITLPLDVENEKINQMKNSIFMVANQTQRDLKYMAQDLAIPVSLKKLHKIHRFQNEDLLRLEQGFFTHRKNAPHPSEHVVIVEAVSSRVEIEKVAADIKKLCRTKNYRYQEIGIAVRDTENYEDLLQMVFKEYEIPFFLATKRLSVHHPLAELLRSIFDVIEGFSYDAVFRLLKTGFFLDVNNDIKFLENYVLEFGIRGKAWKLEEDWYFCDREYVEDEEKKKEEDNNEIPPAVLERLLRINKAKNGFLLPVLHFGERVKRKKNAQEKNTITARDITEALYLLLEELNVPETLEKWALDAEKSGNLAEAREHRQLWDDVINLFDQIVEISGREEKMPLKEYKKLLDDGLDGLKMALIPPGLDHVTIASFANHGLENFRAVYVVGLNEGSIPYSFHDTGILSDIERAELKNQNIHLRQDSVTEIGEEFYLIYKAFTAPRDYLHLSYTLSDAEGTGQIPSSLVEYIRTLVGIQDIFSVPLDITQRDDEYVLAAPFAAVSSLGVALRSYVDTQILKPHWREVYNWVREKPYLRERFEMIIAGIFAQANQTPLSEKTAHSLYLEENKLKGSVTRFEKFHQCPFAHFASYGLNLKERKEYRFKAVDLGSLLHETMRQYGDWRKREHLPWEGITEEERFAFCQNTLEKLAQKLPNKLLESTAQYAYLLKRITSTADKSLARLIGYVQDAKLKPLLFEQGFSGKKGDLLPLRYRLSEMGEDISLLVRGKIDRVDMSPDGKEFLIIDYKTGAMDIHLNEVFFGLKLQLLTYLAVIKKYFLKEDKSVMPVGMLYSFLKNTIEVFTTPLDPEEVKDSLEQNLKMKGWLINNPELIRALDSKNKYLSVRLTKDGIHKSDLRKVKTAEEFNLLIDYVEKIFVETGEKILRGEILAHPYKIGAQDACTYCPYNAFCAFDESINGYAHVNYASNAQAKDEDYMSKMREIVEKKGKENA